LRLCEPSRSKQRTRGHTGPKTLSDYKKVDGITVAHKLTQAGGENNIEIIIEKMTFNVDIPAGQFDLPPEIKAIQENKP
jgi:outer membrane lipoprotein-sorting protein